MAKHARLSASNAERWMTCPGSVPLTEHLPNTSSEDADEGTAAHFLAAECLVNKVDAKSYHGRTIALCVHEGTGDHFEVFEERANVLVSEGGATIRNTFHVSNEMVNNVQKYLDDVRRVALSMNGEILVEQRMSIQHLTGEEGAESTADTVILGVHPDNTKGEATIVTIDLKYGQGVAVSAIGNKQLRMYGSAARNQFGLLNNFEHFHNVIHQPRLNSVTEDKMLATEMDAFEAEVMAAAQRVREATIVFHQKGDITPYLKASEKGCRWCKLANCDVRTKFVEDTIGAEMVDLTKMAASGVAKLAEPENDPVTDEDLEKLAVRMEALPIIEAWMKAIRGRVEALLFAGKKVPRFKLVKGKAGNREWSDLAAALKILKGRKLKLKDDQLYKKTMLTPTQIQDLLNDTEKYELIKPYITQKEGGPSVAPISDKRDEYVITPVDDEMVDLTAIADAPEVEDLLGL